MNKRTSKKKRKQYNDWFSKNKIPQAFANEKDRKKWVSYMTNA